MIKEPYLQVLGTGDSGAVNYWNTGFLIRSRNANLLIDCGFTIKYALRDVALSLAEVDAVFITHVHGDHVHGLERLGFESRYRYRRRPQLLLAPGIREELWDRCLAGTMGNGGAELEDYFAVYEVGERGFFWQGVSIQLFATDHVPDKPSYGLVVNDSVIVTADTKPLTWLGQDRSNRTIIHDCCLAASSPVHATIAELSAYPQAVKERLWVIHYGDEVDSYRRWLTREFAGVAEQGQRFALEASAEPVHVPTPLILDVSGVSEL